MKEFPSSTHNKPWIYARSPHKITGDLEDAGKWLIFASLKDIDSVWNTIRVATEAGDLGIASKVSTMYPTQYDPNQKVICIYNQSYHDKDEVMRIRNELKKLGFTKKIGYKTDRATRQGKYGDDSILLWE